MKKLICMIITIALIMIIPLSATGNGQIALAAAAPTTINYLILGDSLAAGTDNAGIQNGIKTILAKYPRITLLNYLPLMSEINQLQSNPNKYIQGNQYRYTYQFRDYLKTKASTVNCSDWSVPGYTSAQLLSQLKSLSLTNLNILKKATHITIAIGGNDIMPAGDESGFSYIDTKALVSRVATLEKNLSATLDLIKRNNSTATIIVMNLFNLYHPAEMATDQKLLYDQVDACLKPGTGALGNWFMALPQTYGSKLKIADTYSLFDQVNHNATGISTANTYAARPGFLNVPYNMQTQTTFPARFVVGSNTTTVFSPYPAWIDYQSDWARLTSNKGITGLLPAKTGVAFDLYVHFYNPKNYVFGHDADTSEIYQLVKNKCDALTWSLMKSNLNTFIGTYAKWRDVHCTELGHSLIARAHIDALNK